MTEHHFETHHPIRVHVEIGAGSIRLTATDTTDTTVILSGPGADETTVTGDGGEVRVTGPQRSGFFKDNSVHVTISAPTGSSAALRSGSGEITTTGELDRAEMRSGSGDVRVECVGAASLQAGSGDVTVETARGDLAIKTGSGDITLGEAHDAVVASSGSGDVRVRLSHGPIAAKTGSGSVDVVEAHHDVSLATGSGDLEIRLAHRGRITLKGASGNARIGIPAGTPVWTDINTLSGRILSTLESAGQPADGQDYVEVRATTVSGNIHLTHV